jgi:hypothetical protein
LLCWDRCNLHRRLWVEWFTDPHFDWRQWLQELCVAVIPSMNPFLLSGSMNI